MELHSWSEKQFHVSPFQMGGGKSLQFTLEGSQAISIAVLPLSPQELRGLDELPHLAQLQL